MTMAPQPSVARTLIKTLALVSVTAALMASLRFSAVVAGWVDRVAGTRLWSSLYRLAGASDALSRERMIMAGVTVTCFVLALPIVQAGEWCVERVRGRRG
ncbi:hypothetical protein [Gluconacetobacter tumulisoli]|uniref:Uncharacterized protein n=1 Tax=Gluconacetobacter tumulisoli TaxID=1286189 RepID=A0A7W4K9C0_9PROT|nr:hypothetical protein [Gluconacetobacter tumulisoli]MBB2202744.1 hypothetical protein [Gluconacetobacter tumulisoli]